MARSVGLARLSGQFDSATLPPPAAGVPLAADELADEAADVLAADDVAAPPAEVVDAALLLAAEVAAADEDEELLLVLAAFVDEDDEDDVVVVAVGDAPPQAARAAVPPIANAKARNWRRDIPAARIRCSKRLTCSGSFSQSVGARSGSDMRGPPQTITNTAVTGDNADRRGQQFSATNGPALTSPLGTAGSMARSSERHTAPLPIAPPRLPVPAKTRAAAGPDTRVHGCPPQPDRAPDRLEPRCSSAKETHG